jgi:predicted cobalt transporter CbtA
VPLTSGSPAGDPTAVGFRWYLHRGVIAGGFTGVLSALFMITVQQPRLRAALVIEAERHLEHGHDHGEMFSRGTQVVAGMLGHIIYATVLAVIFTVVFVSLRHRLGGGADLARSIRLAALGFTTVALVPALKYPADPPGVGESATVGQRTAAYLTLMAAGVLLAVLAWQADGRLRRRGLGDRRRQLLVAATFGGGIALALLLWPAGTTAPADFPARLLWEFRLASLAGLALVWAGIGVTFGLLTSRPTTPDRWHALLAPR